MCTHCLLWKWLCQQGLLVTLQVRRPLGGNGLSRKTSVALILAATPCLQLWGERLSCSSEGDGKLCRRSSQKLLPNTLRGHLVSYCRRRHPLASRPDALAWQSVERWSGGSAALLGWQCPLPEILTSLLATTSCLQWGQQHSGQCICTPRTWLRPA